MNYNSNKNEAGLADYVFQKVPPQAIPLEEAVLGAILLDKDAMTVVLDILSEKSFYKEAHQTVFRACFRLFQKQMPIDLLTVLENLKLHGELDAIGGGYQLTEMTNRVGSSANVEAHARIIQQYAVERQLIKASSEIIKQAFDPTVDSFNVLENAEKSIFEIAVNGFTRASKDIATLGGNILKELSEAAKKPDGLTGVPAGFTALDRVTNGWQKSDLIIMAARPGMGKTSFVLSAALNAAKIGKPVAIFSLEMSATQLVKRLISQEGEISSSKLQNGKMEPYEWQQLQHAMEVVTSLPIHIDDTPGISIYELRAKCRRLKMQHKIELVVVDYLQLMSGGSDFKGGNREQEISTISRGLKALAKELDVPVIALSQLSRAVETRGGSKRPILSDLRESGAIEQDADIVSFIYRPEYYQILQDESGNSVKGIAEIIIAKHRNGGLDTVMLKFIEQFTQFADLEIEFKGFEPINVSEPKPLDPVFNASVIPAGYRPSTNDEIDF